MTKHNCSVTNKQKLKSMCQTLRIDWRMTVLHVWDRCRKWGGSDGCKAVVSSRKLDQTGVIHQWTNPSVVSLMQNN